jgi:hypothetical protein
MSSSVLSPEDFIAAFPRKPEKIQGPPTFESLRELRKTLQANAASVPSVLGGGAHGYLGVILTQEAYEAIAPGTPFVKPAQPPLQAVIPDGATAAQIGQAVRNHTEDVRQYREYINITMALRNQLTQAIEHVYLRSQYNEYVGYANKTPSELLTYIFRAYGRITPQELLDNNSNMTKPWDPSTPLEDLIDQIERATEIAAAAEQPYTEKIIINTAYALIYKTGLYYDETKTWNAKPAADKTWSNFKLHFFEAQTEHRAQERNTTGRQGYGHWCQEVKENQMAQEHAAAALANLAEASATDRTALATLAATNQNLTSQLESALKAISDLQTLLKNGKGRPARGQHEPHDCYCWTHGYRVSKGHTSQTCKFPNEGHKREATKHNIMGGSTAGQKKNNDT